MKGIISLDIDGTLTGPDHQVAPEVVSYLHSLYEHRWQFIFISGRSYSWTVSTLRDITFPYFLAVYNGGYLLSMPDGVIAERHLLDRENVKQLFEVAEQFSTGVVLYTGFDNLEKIYFIPSKFDAKTLEFFEERNKITQESWVAIHDYEEIPETSLTAAKFFVKSNQADLIAEIVNDTLGLYAPIIQDPVNESFIVLQTTHPKANKGSALESFSTLFNWSGVRIAAGNDMNDLPMFQKAQITVAMQNSPLQLRQIASVIAPPVEDFGLISGLKLAIAKYESTV